MVIFSKYRKKKKIKIFLKRFFFTHTQAFIYYLQDLPIKSQYMTVIHIGHRHDRYKNLFMKLISFIEEEEEILVKRNTLGHNVWTYGNVRHQKRFFLFIILLTIFIRNGGLLNDMLLIYQLIDLKFYLLLSICYIEMLS